MIDYHDYMGYKVRIVTKDKNVTEGILVSYGVGVVEDIECDYLGISQIDKEYCICVDIPDIENFSVLEKINHMKAKYLGQSDPLRLLKDKIYDILSIEKGWYRIVDETGEDYLYPPDGFEIVEGE